MLTDEEIALGGYRYEDLLAMRIVTNRTDLDRKQSELGFPKPIKTGKSQAWFPKAEVHDWLRERAALRDAPVEVRPKRGPGRPRAALREVPVESTDKALPKRGRGRPRKVAKA